MHEPWVPKVRTERLQHTHITQDENGVEGCPPCDSVEPWHMTREYALKGHHFLLANGIVPRY